MDKTKFTPELISELKGFYVERVVDNMDTKDLVNYVMDDLDRYYEKCQMQIFLKMPITIGKIHLMRWSKTSKNILIVNSKRTEGRISVPIIFPHTYCTFFTQNLL